MRRVLLTVLILVAAAAQLWAVGGVAATVKMWAVGGVAATAQLWAVGGVAATAPLWAVGGVAATAPLWAVELSTEDEKVARLVAGDLGMVVAGKVFSNVFLMRGESDDDERKSDKERQEENSPRLNHRLIVWSERQVGRRRASGSERANRAVPGSSSEGQVRDSREADVRDTREAGVRDSREAGVRDSNGDRVRYYSVGRVKQVSGERDNLRQVRDIGGLDRTFPSSPWDFPKTRDPLRWRQWYLGPGAGMHLNVTGLWASGVRGGGVSVAILDDGVELTHLDLALNYDPAASWDLLDSDPDPTPVPWSRHGTQLAGIIAATHFNGMCGMGVAPWSGVGAVRMLGYAVWDATEAEALTYGRDHVDVYVAAWGPVDTGAVLEGPGVLASRALRESIALGREGRGSIYVWASGNGGFVGDDCNADGYANSIYTLTVSGSTRGGRPPSYAETCAATFVSTYSGDADEELDAEEELDPEDQVNGVVTTDTGGVCTESFRGSSVSAAMVAGACALALDANPNLRWRDMQHLMVRAATPHNPLPTQWKKNGAGISYSHYFGFGSLNAGRMVDLARQWKSVPPAFRCHMHAPHHNLTLVPDLPLVLSLTVSGCQVVQAEHIQVNASISARSRGQVEVSLESPSGTVTTLLPQRPLDLSPYGIYNHPLMSVHMWSEDPRGTWKLRVIYHGSSVIGPIGSKRLVKTPNMLHNWTLIIHGTEVFPDRTSPSHYYYSLAQLSRKQRHQNKTGNVQMGMKRARNPRPMEEERVRVEVQYWNSSLAGGGSVHSYLFCRVRAPVSMAVSSINWYKSNGEMIKNVVRRMSGNGAFTAKYPALLLVLEATDVGNFTCKVVYDNDIVSQDLEVTGHSTVPIVTETTQVSVEGGNVSLSCDSLLPFLRGTWTREGKQVTPSPRVTVTEDKLTISSVERQDLGVYKCLVRSARLHYSHTAAVTLLLAQGPSTLITHYAITSHPPPPASTTLAESSCSSQRNTTDASVDTVLWGLGGPGSRRCPFPYKALEGRCLLVAPGEARSWQRARTQCRRQGGDLLVLQDAALMLALMQLFYSQGLSNTSFWVGGVRQGVEDWWWVDGTYLTLGSAFWYPTFARRPKEVPESRSLHQDSPLRRKQGAHRPSVLGTGRRGRSGGRSAQFRPRVSPHHKQRTSNSKFTRIRQVPVTMRLKHSGSRLTKRPEMISGIQSLAVPPADDVSENTHTSEEGTPSAVHRGPSRTSEHPVTSSRVSPGTPINPKILVNHLRELEQQKRNIDSLRKERVSDGPWLRKAQEGHQHNAAKVLRGRQFLETTLPGVAQQPIQEPLQTNGERLFVLGGQLPDGSQPLRAVCLWARFRHFFASCLVTERLKALCEYKPGTSEHNQIPSRRIM